MAADIAASVVTELVSRARRLPSQHHSLPNPCVCLNSGEYFKHEIGRAMAYLTGTKCGKYKVYVLRQPWVPKDLSGYLGP